MTVASLKKFHIEIDKASSMHLRETQAFTWFFKISLDS